MGASQWRTLLLASLSLPLALSLALSLAVLVGCPADGGVDDPENETGLGEPCRSDGDGATDLCLGTLVCVEEEAGIGGRCLKAPSTCDDIDVDDLCDCAALPTLCGDGVTTTQLCYVVSGHPGIICPE